MSEPRKSEARWHSKVAGIEGEMEYDEATASHILFELGEKHRVLFEERCNREINENLTRRVLK